MPRSEAALRIVTGTQQGEEERFEKSLRPERLEDFVGHDNLRERLAIAIEAAQKLGHVVDHILLSGPPGLGKTSLANIVATELESNFVVSHGAALKTSADLIGLLMTLGDDDVLFIDEIHRLPKPLEEQLYTAMEDFRLDLVMPDQEGKPSAYPIHLRRFTLIGATTRKGMLTGALRSRFGIDLALTFYDANSLARIVTHSATVLGMRLAGDTAHAIGKRARGTPRIANRLLRRVRDYSVTRSDSPDAPIDEALASKAMLLEGVDGTGMDDLDRRYLEILCRQYRGGPVGVRAIAATMQEDADTLEDTVEPFLLHNGFLLRTSTGRKATDKAIAHIGSH